MSPVIDSLGCERVTGLVEDMRRREAERVRAHLRAQLGARSEVDEKLETLRRQLRESVRRAAESVSATLEGLASAFANLLRPLDPALFAGRRNDKSSLLVSRIVLGADRRRVRLPGPSPVFRAHVDERVSRPPRLLGGRQSYARVRCDRRRALQRAERRSHGR